MPSPRNFTFPGAGFHAVGSGSKASPTAPEPGSLGPLGQLVGTWKGAGFNQIWRPVLNQKDAFLELNQTLETLVIEEISGDVPNRGLLQGDINLRALHYFQTVTDAIAKGPDGKPAGLHAEPGLWLSVPATTAPSDPATVARIATIPHGTAVLLQGTAFTIGGPPPISPVSITPFEIGQPDKTIPFDEANLSTPSANRTPAQDIPNVTQAMLDNPNSVLLAALNGQTILSTTTLELSTSTAKVSPPASGGGTSNIAFLDGAAGGASPNARTVQTDSVFWIEQVKLPDGEVQLQLQYSQRVLLNFNGLSWPHVSVATLIRQP